MIAWHTRSIEGILKALNSNIDKGLSTSQVQVLRGRFGNNVIGADNQHSIFSVVLRQLGSPLSVILVLSLIFTIALGSYTDAVVIFVALAINIAIGAYQEGKATKVFSKLQEEITIKASVLRDGNKLVVDAKELVPGDIVFIVAGSKVPADLRLIEANNLHTNESAITGEWQPVKKFSDALSTKSAELSDLSNMALMGTVVTEGFGKGIVVATGSDASFGKLARSIDVDAQSNTPLKDSISKLSLNIVSVIGIIVAIIFVLGVLRGGLFVDMLLLSIAVAIAAMPEGLPAAVTVVLSVAMEAIMRKGGLVKNLLAAETLGTTTVILTDKTGTLTKGEMLMREIYTADNVHTVQDVEGDTLEVLKMALLASDAFIEQDTESNKEGKVRGRPLERAIVEGALMAGLRQEELFASGHARREFLQFEASRRYAVSLNDYKGSGAHRSGNRMYITGSPEHILSHATHYLHNGKKKRLNNEVREQFKQIQDTLSSEGRRFTAVAYKDSTEGVIPGDVQSPQEGERLGFVFGGLLAFSDTLRGDVPEAIATAKAAGIKIIMVTGDHNYTAKAVAEEAGLDASNVILGKDFAKLADEALILAVNNNNIFARMLPEQKLRLVTVLKEHGETVAMTGDGINDAPALVSANIGIAQGSGTDVAKEASDLILVNGSFSVIVSAIREGRRALSNLRKVVVYLLSTSAGSMSLIGGSMVAGLALPLLPAQILWANVVGGGLMSFVFAFEPAEEGIMHDGPNKKSLKSTNILFANGLDKLLVVAIIVTGTTLLSLYTLLHYLTIPIDQLRTIMFVAISLDSIFIVFSFKNFKQPIWQNINSGSLLNNRYLLIALVVSVGVLLLALNVPLLMQLLSLTPLQVGDIVPVVILGLLNLLGVELAKYIFISKK